MPVAALTFHQRRYMSRLERIPNRVNGSARRATAAAGLRDTTRADMKGLRELHPEFASANVRDRSAYWVALFGVLGVGVWGWIFDAPLIEYIVNEYLKGSDAQVNAARILCPLAILIVEMSIAEQRHLAGPEFGGTYVAWTMLAGVMALTVPGMAAAAQMALETGNARDGVFLARIGLIVSLGIVLHTSLLFGGAFLHDSRGYLVFKLRETGLQRQEARLEKHVQRHEQEAFNHFAGWVTERNAFEATSPSVRTPGPLFEAATQAIITRRLEYSPFQAPAAGTTPGMVAGDVRPAASEIQVRPAPTPSGNSVPDGASVPTTASVDASSADGEVEYLRGILERRVRAADTEVTP